MGIRINTGIKYWRITGNTEYKEAYRPDWAREKAARHAGDFMFNREKQIEHLASHMDRKPIVVAPYDAELFGHWWFEGPMWIEFLARKIFYDQNTIKMITPSEYLSEYPTNQMVLPSQSSWGYKGYNEFWLEGSNDWVYRHLHIAEERMAELCEKFGLYLKKSPKNIIRRALNQAARELVLAESSDWPFIMKTGTMVPYANKRVTQHINRFTRIYDDLMNNNTIDPDWLAEVEWRDNIFQEMDCANYYMAKKIVKKDTETNKRKNRPVSRKGEAKVHAK